jgi:hypothetical protein
MFFFDMLRLSRRTLLRQLGATGVLVTLRPAGAWAMQEMVQQAMRSPIGTRAPHLAFFTVATESGLLRFEWIDDKGTVYATEAEITVA